MTLALGFPHPRYLLPYLTANDLEEWLTYGSLEPFGAVREDLRAGLILSQYHNANRKEGAEIRNWFDFLPNSEMPQPEIVGNPDENPEQSFMNFVDRFQSWAASRVKKKGA